jgi:hypothetical protein
MIVDIFDFLITLLFIQFMICVVLHVTRFHIFPKSFKEACRMCWLPWVLKNLKNIEKEDKEFSFGRKDTEKKQARKEELNIWGDPELTKKYSRLKSTWGNVKKTKPIYIMLQEELINRVNAFCAEQEMTIHEFVTDAIIEKLERVHKERRKTPRL